MERHIEPQGRASLEDLVGTSPTADLRKRLELGRDCWLDLQLQDLVKDGLRVALSAIEFRLLRALAANPGGITPSEALIEIAWGSADRVYRHELHVYIHRVRRRLEDNAAHPRCIITVHRIGYMFRPR